MRLLLPVIVICAAIAGALAYHQAQRQGRPEYAVTGSWGAVRSDRVRQGLRASAAVYVARVERRRGLVAVRREANRYLASLGEGSSVPGGVVLGRGAGAGAAELVRWASLLPRDRLRRSVDSVRLPRTTIGVAHAVVELTVPRASSKSAPIAASIEIVVRRRAGAWSVVDARADPGGIRTLRQPELLVEGRVAILADSVHASDEPVVLGYARDALPDLVRRYRDLDGPTSVLIVVSDSAGAGASVLGIRSATDESTVRHASGLTYETGDVVLVWPQLASEAQLTRYTTIRHELTHVVALPLIKRVPTMLLEGTAVFEETVQLDRTYGRSSVDLATLDRAFRRGAVGYPQLLRSRDPTFGRRYEFQIEVGYLAGYATVAYIERHYGHRRLVRLLARLGRGVAVEAALRESIGIDSVQLQRAVKAFAHAPAAVQPAA